MSVGRWSIIGYKHIHIICIVSIVRVTLVCSAEIKAEGYNFDKYKSYFLSALWRFNYLIRKIKSIIKQRPLQSSCGFACHVFKIYHYPIAFLWYRGRWPDLLHDDIAGESRIDRGLIVTQTASDGWTLTCSALAWAKWEWSSQLWGWVNNLSGTQIVWNIKRLWLQCFTCQVLNIA